MADDKDDDLADREAQALVDGAATDDAAQTNLSQEEISQLLDKDGASGKSPKQGVHALIDNDCVSYERLPMLEVACDRLVRILSTSLRNFTSENVDIALDSISSIRFGDYINGLPLPTMIGVVKAVQWDNYGLMVADTPLIYSIIDVLLGGRRGTSPMLNEGRIYTAIEQRLLERLIQLVLADLSQSFAPITPITFTFDRIETNPSFASIVTPINASLLIRLRISMDERGGLIDLLFPYATIEPAREALSQMFMGEKFGRDTIWEHHFAEKVWTSDLEVSAVLDTVQESLADVLDWKKGTHLKLSVTPQSRILLYCGEKPVFMGRMGHKGDNIAIAVENNFLTHKQEGA